MVIDGANVIADARARAVARLDAAVQWAQAWRPDLPVFVYLDHGTFARRDAATRAAIAARVAAGAAGRATWCVCPAGLPADLFVLRAAAQRCALVVANDRYAEHAALRANALTLQFTFAGGRFAPAAEATWFRAPGHARRVPLAELRLTRD